MHSFEKKNMEWFCDGPETQLNNYEKISEMTDEEFEAYLKSLNDKENDTNKTLLLDGSLEKQIEYTESVLSELLGESYSDKDTQS